MTFRLHPFPRSALIVALVFYGTSCATFKKHKKEEASPERDAQPAVAVRPGPLRVGAVTLVNEAEHFVLIDTGLGGVPAIGMALKTFTGEESSGVVTVGNVNRRPFIVADVVQGAPKKGDGVFQ